MEIALPKCVHFHVAKSTKRFSAEWIQNFLGHESYKTTMDMYGTLSIDEMQEVAARLLD